MDTIAIVGMGLIGGSIGMAVKNKGISKKVIGISRNIQNLEEAVKKEAIDEYTLDLIDGTKSADIVFICTPISTVVPTAKTIFSSVKDGCIITDVASSKADIVKELERCVPERIFFVGGHPMAGSERSGIKAATKYLLEGNNYVLTQTSYTNKSALQKLVSFIEKLDVNITIMTPEEHDFTVAAISHMPIAIAVSLVNTIVELKQNRDNCVKLASSGFRDTTRIASGNIQMGIDMFSTNKSAILEMLKNFKSELDLLESAIRNGDLKAMENLLKKAKEFRDSIYGS